MNVPVRALCKNCGKPILLKQDDSRSCWLHNNLTPVGKESWEFTCTGIGGVTKHAAPSNERLFVPHKEYEYAQ